MGIEIMGEGRCKKRGQNETKVIGRRRGSMTDKSGPSSRCVAGEVDRFTKTTQEVSVLRRKYWSTVREVAKDHVGRGLRRRSDSLFLE